MTYHKVFSLPAELLEQVTSEGLEYLPTLIEVMINIAMQAERAKYLKADLYERTDHAMDMPMATSPKRSRRGSEISPLKFPRSEMAPSTREPLKRGCAVKEL